MPASVLIPPDNRLLGWSLSDLTLYGAQPVGDITIGRASEDGTALEDASGAAAGTAPTPDTAAAMSEGERAADETTALLESAGAQPPLPNVAPAPALADHGAVDAANGPASIPQPVGAGSILTTPVATPLQVATAEHGQQGSTDGLAGAQALAADPLATLAAPVVGVAQTAEGLMAPVQALATDPLGHLAQSAEDAVAPLGGVDPIGTIDTVVADLGAATLLPNDAIDVTGLTGGGLDQTPLSSFGGSDPAAGLQTLIGMVETSEVFDLGQATTAPGTDLASTGSILDSLAADAAPPPLLGDEDGGVDTLLDHHGIHLDG